MLEMISVVIAVASLSLTILLERKKITAEYRQIREEMRIKAAYKQKAAPESHSPKPVIIPTMEQYRAASKTFLSIALEILKTFVAVICTPISFVLVVTLIYVIFQLPTDGNFSSIIFWGSIPAGLIYGAVVLRKKTWGSIFKFFGVLVLGSSILVVIYALIRSLFS